jgi:CheY-like chemotaxis protein
MKDAKMKDPAIKDPAMKDPAIKDTDLKDTQALTKPPSHQPVIILMADDDADDRLMAKEALEVSGLRNEIRFVEDGVELLKYLLQQGRYQEAPRPGLILLDMNMPRKNGREALSEIKTHPELKRIPVVILTTSQAEEDVKVGYDLGANSYITKPVTFEGLVKVMQTLSSYWLEIVRSPEGLAKEVDQEARGGEEDA